jgi:arabinose-5-phosphate isomerase
MMVDIDILEEARKVFAIEIESLLKVKDELDENFTVLVKEILACQGRVILTGMGKSGHIAKKIAATMSSLGTPAYFLHPAEGAHGDLGVITKDDIILAVSYSGETDEIIQLIPSIKKIKAGLVSITCRPNSTLERHADLSIHLDIIREACMHNLAPTTSSTATLVFGDALAIVLSKMIGFQPENFAVFHPKGSLGKRLLTKVSDLMFKDEENPIIDGDEVLKKAIIIMSEKGLGAISVVDADQKLVGIITDGDLRRTIEKYDSLPNLKVCDIMTKNPIVIAPDALAVEAIKPMQEREIMVLPVVDKEQRPVGMIRLHDIIKAGIVE